MDVACIGILVADCIGRPIDVIPARGTLGAVDNIELHTGGCAANTGTALARLGVKAGLVGKVGQDGFGDYMISALGKSKLDTTGIKRTTEKGTSATLVLVHGDGERTFLHSFGANATFREEDVNWDFVKQAKILHVAGAFLMPAFDGQPTANVLKHAKEIGLTTCLDTAFDGLGRWKKLIEPCFPYSDYFTPSIEEAKAISGEPEPKRMAERFIEWGVKTAIIKAGPEGSYVHDGKTFSHVPAFQVKTIDGTGAGDCFVAGFLAGLINKGDEWSLPEILRFANAVGGMSVTAVGASNGVKSFDETLEFMKTAKVM